MAKNKILDRFVAVATGFALHPAENGSSPQVSVKLRRVDDDRAGEEVTYWGPLHENSQQFTAEALRNMGWTCNDITKCEGLGSTKVAVVIAENVYEKNGKTITGKKVQVWPIGGKAVIEDSERESFAKQFKALAAATKPITVTPANAAPAELPPAKAKATNSTPPAAVDGPPITGAQQF